MNIKGTIAIVFGILGRQGNKDVLFRLESLLKKRNMSYYIILAEEVNSKLMDQYTADTYIQLCCPRISIDWGQSFPKPLLNALEAFAALKEASIDEEYPLSYYAYGGKEWTNYFPK